MRLAGCFLLVALSTGCTRGFWRAHADRETYPIVAERAWAAEFAADRLTLDPPSPSRLADPTDPDRPPKPPDDAVAAAYMARPNGMHGAHWNKHGEIDWIEPPGWENHLPLGPEGKLTLNAERAFEIALLHSREYQAQLEQLYLSALALTLNRFEFQTRWFLRNATNYTSAAGGTPGETSTLDSTTNLGFQRSLAAGGQLVVDFANSFVLEYLGNGRTSVSSTFVATFVQPLLRGAGRRVRLEQLTQAERDVLYAARDFYRFRKQFWAGITTLEGGYLSLLLQVQTLRNAQTNRLGQEQNLRLHEELFKGGKKSIVQVDQAFQANLQGELRVTQGEAALQAALDQFKVRLGLPPRIPVVLDDTVLNPFVLADPKLEKVRDEIETYQKLRNRDIDAAPALADLRQQYTEYEALAARVEPFVAVVAAELADWGRELPAGDDDAARRVRATYEQFRETYPDTAKDLAGYRAAARADAATLAEAKRKESWEALVVHTRKLLSLVDTIIAVQTQVRINRITLPPITWTEAEGLAYAKANRLDLQTARAAVTDAWRKMWVAANALRSELNLVAGAQLGTRPDPRNAFDFAADASRFRVGVQFDGPLNRQAERNAYRASQIAYQQARRAFMLLSDQVEQSVRNDLRSLNLARVNFEIARLTVVSAARQLEGSRQRLLQPQRNDSDTSTLDVLNALNSLLEARNALAAGYINYEQLRVQLLLDLEALRLDPRGYPLDERRPEFAGDRTPEADPAGPAARIGPRRSKLPYWKPAGAFFGIGGLVLAGWLAWPRGPVADVLTAAAVRGDMPVVVVERGELDSTNSVVVRCDVEGERIKLVSIVPEGTRVAKGDEVCRFDTDELQKQFELQEVKWKTAESKAKAAVGDLAVQKNKEKSEIDKADLLHRLAVIDLEKYIKREFDVSLERLQGKVGLAKRNLKEAQDNLEFTRNLVKKGFLPLEQVRLMELGVEEKKFSVREGEAELGMLQEFDRKRKIAELEGKAKEAQEELARTKESQKAATEKAQTDLDGAQVTARLEKVTFDRIKAQMDRCIVKAPQDGIVVYFKRYYDESSRIQPGASLFYQQPIFTLPDLSKMKVKVKIHESVIKKIAKDQKATLVADALPNRPMTGTVKSVATLAQNEGWRQTVKEYQVEIEIDDLPTDGGLKPGMTAETKIHVQIVPNAVMVPVQAVTEYEGKPICYVRKGRGLERRSVEVGESNDQYLQLLSGVDEGEHVALDARSRAAAEVKAAKK